MYIFKVLPPSRNGEFIKKKNLWFEGFAMLCECRFVRFLSSNKKQSQIFWNEAVEKSYQYYQFIFGQKNMHKIIKSIKEKTKSCSVDKGNERITESFVENNFKILYFFLKPFSFQCLSECDFPLGCLHRTIQLKNNSRKETWKSCSKFQII